MSGTNYSTVIHRANDLRPRSDFRRDPPKLPELWFEHWEDYYLGDAGYHDQLRNWVWHYERYKHALDELSSAVSLLDAGRLIREFWESL